MESIRRRSKTHDGGASRYAHPAKFVRRVLQADRTETPFHAGANTEEVAIMGTLTVNMHLLLCSFYRPTKERYKILFEAKAFPSDNYAFASQAEMHGFDRKDALVRVAPREGEYCLRIEDILSAIEREGDQGKFLSSQTSFIQAMSGSADRHTMLVAVVFFSGVNYFTGQVFDMQRITEAAHKKVKC